MADRRMFHKHVIDSDNFLDMPASSQALYFHLAMRADDEGFVGNPKKIQKMIGANDDDAKILLSKEFLKIFKSGVVVVSHWKIHNNVRKDRLKKTIYQDEKNELTLDENNVYISSEKEELKTIENNKEEEENNEEIDNQMTTKCQHRLDYVRLDYIRDKQLLQYINTFRSDEEKNKFLEEWLEEKSKSKLSPSAYKANLINRLKNNEESVIDEFSDWCKIKIKNKIINNAIGKIIKTSQGKKTILGIEFENKKLNVYFNEGGFVVISSLTELEKIIKKYNKEN